MVSYQDALERMLKVVQPLASERLPLTAELGVDARLRRDRAAGRDPRDQAADVGPRLVKLAMNHRLVGRFEQTFFIEFVPVEICKHDFVRLGKEKSALLRTSAADQHAFPVGAPRAHVTRRFLEQAEPSEDLASQCDFFG